MPKNSHAIFFSNALIAASSFKAEAKAFVEMVADGLSQMRERVEKMPSGVKCPQCGEKYLDEDFSCECGFKFNPPKKRVSDTKKSERRDSAGD